MEQFVVSVHLVCHVESQECLEILEKPLQLLHSVCVRPMRLGDQLVPNIFECDINFLKFKLIHMVVDAQSNLEFVPSIGHSLTLESKGLPFYALEVVKVKAISSVRDMAGWTDLGMEEETPFVLESLPWVDYHLQRIN